MEINTVSVTELTRSISYLLEEEIGGVSVRGEISNFKAHSSGHKYFTLKDEGAQISCTLWRGRSASVNLSDGMKVIITGNLTVYPPRGQYQIECMSVMPVGIGELFVAFEALKSKLDELGYFDAERKRPIPK